MTRNLNNPQESPLKYQSILEEFLKYKEWTDELLIDQHAKTVALATAVAIGSQSGRLIIEASDESDLVDVYFYYGINCKKNKFEQMCVLLIEIHRRWSLGRFELDDEGHIRWHHRVDFEGSNPTAVSIERIVQPGWDAMSRFAEIISSVALTKQTAAEAIEEFDASNP
jgi:hypothetical protein